MKPYIAQIVKVSLKPIEFYWRIVYIWYMGKAKGKATEDYSKRLKRLRLSLDMTHREFAEKFMVQHSTIGLWESGNREIPGPAKMLIKIYEVENKKNKAK